uniref:MUN domain-containing protein n=1 Tax=Timema cristinae TaxID=61476 RepID=A0A7R9D0E2_TIMCR|nr:unnamed protein product [Timema cristinae]
MHPQGEVGVWDIKCLLQKVHQWYTAQIQLLCNFLSERLDHSLHLYQCTCLAHVVKTSDTSQEFHKDHHSLIMTCSQHMFTPNPTQHNLNLNVASETMLKPTLTAIGNGLKQALAPGQGDKLCKAMFHNRRHATAEPLLSLGLNLRRLSAKGFPNLYAAVRDDLAKDQFIEALNDALVFAVGQCVIFLTCLLCLVLIIVVSMTGLQKSNGNRIGGEAFCKTIADECQPFLQRFQTSKPMTPYLFEAVEKLLRYLMNRCVKPDLMKCTGPKLLSIDTKKSENLILSKNIDIGFATKRLLGETAITVTERQKLEFIHECRSMLTTMIAKLQEKSPLKQKAVRGLSSLDPCVIQHSPQLAQKRFSFLLEELNHANIINDVLAENAKKEYLHFCNLKKSELQEIFRPCDQFSDEVGLDTIYGSFLIGEANYKHLWEVIKICLVLSHGNATVEGGFSVNKSLLVENMHEKTVIAQRHIHDEIQEAGGIKNIHISKKMLDYVRGARKRYHEYLEMKKQEKSEKDKKKAEKRKLDIQVKDLEGERKKLMMATEEKREAIDVELQELKKKQASLY